MDSASYEEMCGLGGLDSFLALRRFCAFIRAVVAAKDVGQPMPAAHAN
jgi:hypothetical protein